ncbi:hypothetical protein [Mameliella sediminis]|uniref:hypothetical protein n=1 Tax=Mameliella sediminis TaxID=2836866 RepID=UPI001C449845|nr:hypothetical protein [Mameliella sediminis]MBY6116207.1 hypothetical protein [Antarctobacter heliothermus]MBY6146172.1 hypothetical protein [Mameliella alba]MBV7396835.1 hypothetical protein [Mameliella sediminis]MBY6161829.1 hypothetical protein [Mameliella alba]MBY6170299.1 hypothetical protein [Mameliella alba]
MTRDNVQIGMGHRSLNARIDVFLTEVGFGMNPGQLRRARLRQIIALESASDAELARLGIGRDDILPFVFRDLLAA